MSPADWCIAGIVFGFALAIVGVALWLRAATRAALGRFFILPVLLGSLALSRHASAGPPYTLIFTGTIVGTTPTLVDTTASHIFVKLWSNCSATVFVAFSPAVTTSNGIPVPASPSWIEFDIDSSAGNRLYAIVASGTCDVRVMEKKG